MDAIIAGQNPSSFNELIVHRGRDQNSVTFSRISAINERVHDKATQTFRGHVLLVRATALMCFCVGFLVRASHARTFVKEFFIYRSPRLRRGLSLTFSRPESSLQAAKGRTRDHVVDVCWWWRSWCQTFHTKLVRRFGVVEFCRCESAELINILSAWLGSPREGVVLLLCAPFLGAHRWCHDDTRSSRQLRAMVVMNLKVLQIKRHQLAR